MDDQDNVCYSMNSAQIMRNGLHLPARNTTLLKKEIINSKDPLPPLSEDGPAPRPLKAKTVTENTANKEKSFTPDGIEMKTLGSKDFKSQLTGHVDSPTLGMRSTQTFKTSQTEKKEGQSPAIINQEKQSSSEPRSSGKDAA